MSSNARFACIVMVYGAGTATFSPERKGVKPEWRLN
jgi:hypothetical protein